MKPKITKAMVDAAESVLNQAAPSRYADMNEIEQREVRRAAIRSALTAAILSKENTEVA